MNRESGLWRLLKDGLRKTKRDISTTRLESWANPGVPDVMLCGEDGLFAFLELKIVKHKQVNLSPHQCAWLSRHSHSNSWIITRNSHLVIGAYHAADVVDLRMDGIDAAAPAATFPEPYDWTKFYLLLCPLA